MDLGLSLDEVFEYFDPVPIGVASLAQVHKAILKNTSEVVAVKVQHPTLDFYSQVDIQMCADIVRLVKSAFPEFEFDWLADEMQDSLPKELNFLLEADNGIQTFLNFESEPSITIPKIFWATRRILVMECILNFIILYERYRGRTYRRLGIYEEKWYKPFQGKFKHE